MNKPQPKPASECPGGLLGCGPGQHAYIRTSAICFRCGEPKGQAAVAAEDDHVMVAKVKKAKCPRCGAKCHAIKGGKFRCSKPLCGAITDGVEDGIVASHRDPVRSAIRSEQLRRL